MKILWVNPNFLHPTTKGGRIRTLEILRRLHSRHEIHYAAFENPDEPEGLARAHEYATRVYAFRHRIVSKRSPAFVWQLIRGLFSASPLAISRFYSATMARSLEHLIRTEKFDLQICDFLVSAPYFSELRDAILFQHNVESSIWRRHAENARDPLRRFYFGLQARRMFRFEERACRRAGRIIAVSENDAAVMRDLFGVSRVAAIPTGVDLEYFASPQATEPATDLIFVGSMDWLPNVDGMRWFIAEILPIIRRHRPGCSLAIVGRDPDPHVAALAAKGRNIRLTGTVPDVRPYLWDSVVSIVPLRIGGGTRLKIFESMAARVPVVSTTIGAEGLPVTHGQTILLHDSPESFAHACLDLLSDPCRRARMVEEAWNFVAASFSWDQVTRDFESKITGQLSTAG
jgi:glycosyltransferase involved in cell wall biosynthesis